MVDVGDEDDGTSRRKFDPSGLISLARPSSLHWSWIWPTRLSRSDLMMAVRDIQTPHSHCSKIGHPSNDLSLIAACSGRQNFFIYIFWFVLGRGLF